MEAAGADRLQPVQPLAMFKTRARTDQLPRMRRSNGGADRRRENAQRRGRFRHHRIAATAPSRPGESTPVSPWPVGNPVKLTPQLPHLFSGLPVLARARSDDRDAADRLPCRQVVAVENSRQVSVCHSDRPSGRRLPRDHTRQSAPAAEPERGGVDPGR